MADHHNAQQAPNHDFMKFVSSIIRRNSDSIQAVAESILEKHEHSTNDNNVFCIIHGVYDSSNQDYCTNCELECLGPNEREEIYNQTCDKWNRICDDPNNHEVLTKQEILIIMRRLKN